MKQITHIIAYTLCIAEILAFIYVFMNVAVGAQFNATPMLWTAAIGLFLWVLCGLLFLLLKKMRHE